MTAKTTKTERKPRNPAKPAKVNRATGKVTAASKAPSKPAPTKPEASKASKASPAPGAFARPLRDGPCAQLWSLFDKLQAKLPEGKYLSIGDAKDAAERHSLELGTCTVQFYKWRRTLGVRGRGSKQKVG